MHLASCIRAELESLLHLAPVSKPGEPPRVELFKLRLGLGQGRFTDKAVGKNLKLTAFNVSVSFLSNLRTGRLNLIPSSNSIATNSGATCARIQGAKGQNDAKKEAKNARPFFKVDIASITWSGTVNLAGRNARQAC